MHELLIRIDALDRGTMLNMIQVMEETAGDMPDATFTEIVEAAYNEVTYVATEAEVG